jgi:hypothetical protein
MSAEPQHLLLAQGRVRLKLEKTNEPTEILAFPSPRKNFGHEGRLFSS